MKLAGLCAVFCAGIITAAKTAIPFPVFCLGTLLFLLPALFIKQNIKFSFFVLCLGFFLGVCLIRNSQFLPPDHITHLTGDRGANVSLRGVVDNDPACRGLKTAFIFRIEQVSLGSFWQRGCGKILVRINGKGSFAYGDRLLLQGKLSLPLSFPGGFDYQSYLKHQDIYFIFRAGEKSGIIKLLAKNAGNPLKAFSLAAKHRLSAVIKGNLSVFSAGVMNALILGDRQDLPPYFTEMLMKLGTIHIIAISGFNVGIVAFVILLFLKIMKLRRKPRYIFTLLLLIVYCLLTGSSAPVVRATLMAAIFLGAYFCRRQVDIGHSLSIAVIFILAFNPWQIFEISFQLSFLSLLSIVCLAPKIQAVFPERLVKNPRTNFLILTFSASGAAWIGLLPLVAYYFNTFSALTVMANMIIVPYSALVTATGFSFALIGAFFPQSAPVLASANELLIRVLFKIHSLFIIIPGAYFKLPEVPLIYVYFYYVLLILITNFSAIRGFILNREAHPLF